MNEREAFFKFIETKNTNELIGYEALFKFCTAYARTMGEVATKTVPSAVEVAHTKGDNLASPANPVASASNGMDFTHEEAYNVGYETAKAQHQQKVREILADIEMAREGLLNLNGYAGHDDNCSKNYVNKEIKDLAECTCGYTDAFGKYMEVKNALDKYKPTTEGSKP